MSTETELANRVAGLQIHSIDELARVADMFARSGLFRDAQDAAKAGVKIMAGQAWGIDPFSAMTGINIIAGKPAIGAHLMAAKVKASGKYDYRVREMTEQVCSIEFFQGEESIGVSTFTIEDARKAGTQNLVKFPRNMLFARAMSNGQRWFCPDVFAAPTYTPEELGARVDGEGNMIDVAAVSPAMPAAEKPQLEGSPNPATDADAESEAAPAPNPQEAGENDDAPSAEGDGPGLPEFMQEAPAGGGPSFLEAEAEPRVTAAQLKALHTRLTKLGFDGKAGEKDRAREFIGHFVGRPLESSKELTRSEAHKVLDATDDQLALALDSFNAERGMEGKFD